jgi:hypothetical protein
LAFGAIFFSFLLLFPRWGYAWMTRCGAFFSRNIDDEDKGAVVFCCPVLV